MNLGNGEVIDFVSIIHRPFSQLVGFKTIEEDHTHPWMMYIVEYGDDFWVPRQLLDPTYEGDERVMAWWTRGVMAIQDAMAGPIPYRMPTPDVAYSAMAIFTDPMRPDPVGKAWISGWGVDQVAFRDAVLAHLK